MARFFDNYVMSAMQKPVFEALKAEGARGCPTCSPCCSSSAIVTAPRGYRRVYYGPRRVYCRRYYY